MYRDIFLCKKKQNKRFVQRGQKKTQCKCSFFHYCSKRVVEDSAFFCKCNKMYKYGFHLKEMKKAKKKKNHNTTHTHTLPHTQTLIVNMYSTHKAGLSANIFNFKLSCLCIWGLSFVSRHTLLNLRAILNFWIKIKYKFLHCFSYRVHFSLADLDVSEVPCFQLRRNQVAERWGENNVDLRTTLFSGTLAKKGKRKIPD